MQIAEAFKEIKKMQNAVMFLQGHGITTNMAVKIYKQYQDQTENILQTNPYRLVEDIDGIGFLTADKIAQKLGISPYSEFRFRAGVLHLLKENAEKNGNTYLPADEMERGISKLLQVKLEEHISLIEEVLKRLLLDNAIKVFDLDSQKIIMQTKFHLIEREIAERLLILNQNSKTTPLDLTTEINEYEKNIK